MGHAVGPTLLDELHPAARPAVTAYLDTLAAGLSVSRRARSAIVAEIADGVIEAVREAGEPGKPAHDAAAAALRAFGDPRVLAADLTGSGPGSWPTGWEWVCSPPAR